MRNLSLAAAAALALAPAAHADDVTLKMATIAPSLSAAITMATFANVVSENDWIFCSLKTKSASLLTV